MALGPNTIFDSCPECGCKSLDEACRFEAGEIHGNDEDFAVYRCTNDTCGLIFDYITYPKENISMARDTITWNEFYNALEAQGLEDNLKEKLVNMLKTVQDLGPTDEVKLCKNLTEKDLQKDVWLNDRRLTGVMTDFNDDGLGNFYVVVDWKMHKFTPESIIVLKKTFTGAETLIDG